METIFIGIAGGSGSGKTTLAKKLTAAFPKEKITLLKHDAYYKKHDDITYEERTKLNYDHPDAFDTELLIEHIKKLRAGETIEEPVYDYTVHNRSERTETVIPAPVIVLEGILILADPRVSELMDLKIFVDADADERILRRARRDMRDRGRSIDSVMEQYLNTVKPMHERFVEPSKREADIIVPRGGKNEAALQMLLAYVREWLSEREEEQ